MCRSILFPAFLAIEAFVHKGATCCYTNTKDLYVRALLTTALVSCCWPLPRPPHQSRLYSRRLLPLPSGQKQGKPHCSVPWDLAAPEPLGSNCVQLTPAPSCNISECAFKSSNCKGWENPRVTGNASLWGGAGSVTRCQWRPVPQLGLLTSACALFPDSCCTSSPCSQWRKEVMFWTIWWEVGKAVSWIQSVHLTRKD